MNRVDSIFAWMLPCTRETMDFLQTYLPNRSCSILDIGCGYGAVAQELMRTGYRVVAIDESAEAVVATRALGVEALQSDFLSWKKGEFNALYFGRSFHHIFPLQTAVEHAHRLLMPGGIAILEDFSWENMDSSTARWLSDRRNIAQAALGQPTSPDENPLQSWRHEHEHTPPLHTGASMLQVIREHFSQLEVVTAPFLFRYIGALAQDNTRAAREDAALIQEKRDLEAGLIRPIGLRIIARK